MQFFENISWDTILGYYNEPMFYYYPVATLLLSIGAFLFFALPWTWVAFKKPAWALKYRIQNKEPDPKWILPSLGRLFINSTILFVLILLAWPLIRLSPIHMNGWPSAWEVTWQILLFIFVDDFLFYWFHRALHTKWLYKKVHIVHHRITNTTAISGNYFHFFEYFGTTSLVLLGPTILGSHVLTLWIWVVFRQWEAADGHSGYDVWFNPIHLFPFYVGPSYHDFHHSKFKGNYAGFLGYIDRFFGTFAKGYLEYRDRKRNLMSKKTLTDTG